MGSDKNHERAVDRRRILRGLGVAGATAIAGCISDSENAAEQRERALELLEAGFEEEGFEPPFEGELITNEAPQRVKWTEIVQQTLNNTAYFDLEFRDYEWTVYQEVILSPEFAEGDAIATLGWGAGYDPTEYVNQILRSAYQTPACCNVNRYSNEDLDDLISELLHGFSVAERTAEERIELARELQKLVVEESPLAFVRTAEEYVAYRNDAISDWTVDPFDTTFFSTLYNVPADTAVTFHDPDGDGELKAVINSDIANFDPIFQTDSTSTKVTYPLIYEGLVGTTYDGEPRPWLAESWEELDETTYRFQLREGVEFHNGEELTAEHVAASLQRYEGTPEEAEVFDWLGDGDVVAIDDYEVEIDIQEPYAPLLGNVGDPGIVPLDAIDEEYGGNKVVEDGEVVEGIDLQEQPVGTGPFVHEEYRPGELYRVSRNENYWYDGSDELDPRPDPESVQFRIIVEASVRRSVLESGDVHVAEPAAATLDDLDAQDEFTTDRTIAGGLEYLIPPLHSEPFTNPKVRRGLSLLLPREQIIDTVWDGVGVEAYGPVSPLVSPDEFKVDDDDLLEILES